MTAPLDNPLGLKLMIVGRRKPGSTLAEHRHHIRHVHGEMVLRYIAQAPADAPQRYVQHEVFDGLYRATTPGADPFALNRDFVTQIWVQDFAALTRSRQTRFYLEHLQGDEDNFVDQATVVFMPVREREILSRGATAVTRCKLFGFVQKAEGADARAFAAAWASLAHALRAWPVGERIRRHLQNDVLPKPGPDATVDGIDEFWLDDEAAARTLLGAWQAGVREALVAPGLATESGSFCLLAHEAVLHAGPQHAPSTF